MFSSVYFVLASSLSTAAQLPSYARLVGAGRLSDACSTLASKVEREGEEDDPILLQAYADIQLALSLPIEAEDCYRKAQRAIRDSRTALRIASCRNAGWQAFFQDRFSTAASCFNRVLEEPEASVGEQLESMLGKALVLYHLGCLGAAVSQIDKFSLAAEQVNERGWSNLAAALRYDVWVQHAVRDTESLRDHIYWRSAAHDIGPDMLYESKAPQEQIATSMPLLAQRLEYLGNLYQFARGAHGVREHLDPHLSWAGQSDLVEYHRGLCLEISVAAIAAKAPIVAETLLGQCQIVAGPPHHHQHKRWYLEYLYCLSKVRQQQGRGHESLEIYGRYAFASISFVRADSIVMSAVTADIASPAPSQPNSDDVSTRLPAKYRRAYRYMMEHLDQRDLSVRELAAHIGVSERAIQAAFKTYLGLSPSELIRRQRMERIRGELTREDGVVTSVLDAAHKWGIQHRSTLINGYRKTYNEAPSETLKR